MCPHVGGRPVCLNVLTVPECPQVGPRDAFEVGRIMGM